jgi:hypothetical protein
LLAPRKDDETPSPNAYKIGAISSIARRRTERDGKRLLDHHLFYQEENILGGWRGTGLWPALPMRVLRELPKTSPMPTANLDLSLLESSPPEAVELSKSNKRFTVIARVS